MSTRTEDEGTTPTGAVNFTRLDSFMAGELAGDTTSPVTRKQLSGGMSQMTIIYELPGGGEADRLVVRVPPTEGPLDPYEPIVEAKLMTAVGEFGIAAPEVALIEATGEVIGRAFYATRFVSGAMSAEGAFGPNASADRMAEAYVDQLAAIHAVPVHAPGSDGVPLSALLEPMPVKTPAGVLDRWTEAIAARGLRVPAYQDFLRTWLLARMPRDSGAEALVHGDYRLANMLWTEHSDIAAAMDWEEAGIGDPYLDLAWTLMGSVDDDDEVYGLMKRGWILERYAAQTGVEIDRRRLLWWEVAVGWMLLCMNSLAAWFAAATPSRDMRPLLFCFFNRRIATGYLRKIEAYEKAAS